jgi:Lhr-like helicase
VEHVIVDEVHAVAGTKRGAHLALSLERLERLTARPPQRIGLSATQRPLETIAAFLGGIGPGRAVAIVDAGSRKRLDLSVVVPVEDLSRLGEPVSLDEQPAEEMAALEHSAIEHMNHDHEEAIHLYATKVLKAQPGAWRVLAIDPDGADLGLHEQSLRMEFHTPVFTAEALRKKFAELAYEARTL